MNKSVILPGDIEDDFVLDWSSDQKKRSICRSWKLINEALRRSRVHDWEVNNMEYHSSVVNEPYGIRQENDAFFIWAEQRGKKHLLAVFGDDHIAAKYFVWLASKGEVEINWSLYLDELGV